MSKVAPLAIEGDEKPNAWSLVPSPDAAAAS